MKGIVALGIGMVVAVAFAAGASAGVAYFADPYDTIQVSQGTVLSDIDAATIEARILFSSSINRSGYVFCEWTDSQEDKTLYGGGGNPGQLTGMFFDVLITGPTANPTIAMDAWHHVATVYDGSDVRVYLDGTQVASQSRLSTTINDAGGLPYIGAINRDYADRQSFGGYLDWLRVSDIARYPNGASFTPPSAQPSNDANTQLLFYFDEDPGSTTAVDHSSYGRNGELGVGFRSATRPEFIMAAEVDHAVPSLGLAGLGALILALAAVAVLVLTLRRV